MVSLRRLVRIVFPIALLLLVAVIILGAIQSAEFHKYSSILNENEQALFHFATVRESVTEALVSKDTKKLLHLIPEIEALNTTFTLMQESPYIPAELKMGLMDNIDIADIVIKMRTIDTATTAVDERKKVQEEMRNIANYLLTYDRIIVTKARSRVHSLQLIILGSMGIVITILSFSLILLYRNSILPLLSLTEQLKENYHEQGALAAPGGACREIVELVDALQPEPYNADEQSVFHGRKMDPAQFSQLAEIINESTNQLNGIINYAQLLADTDNDNYSREQKELLGKILDTGGAIARLWKNFTRR